MRVHEDADKAHMENMGVRLAVMGEKEIALGLSAFALQHYGVDSDAVLETLAHLRQGPLLVKA